MPTERILDGSNSVLVRTLTDAAATLLSKSGQLDEFITLFRTTMMAQPEVTRNGKYMRHMAEVIDRLALRAVVNQVKKDPDYTMVATTGMVTTLPTTVTFTAPTNGESTHDFDDLLDLIDPPKPPAEDVSLDEPGTIDEALDGSKRAHDPVYDKMRTLVEEYAKTRQHPFVRTMKVDAGGEWVHYAVVGTCIGKSKRNPNATFNANCTTQNYRKVKDLPDHILVHRNGRPVSVGHDTPDGGRYFLWLLHHRPGLELRFWINVNEPGKPRSDIESGNVRVKLTDDADGWKRA